jgi:hypothetical protein
MSLELLVSMSDSAAGTFTFWWWETYFKQKKYWYIQQAMGLNGLAMT